MKTFTVQAPPEDDRSYAERAVDYVFLKEGYSFWAALFGPFWSLANKMWLEAFIHFVGLFAVLGILGAIGFVPAVISYVSFMANLLFALFAYDLQRFHYSRKGYQMIGVVNGKTKGDCEARFFRAKEEPTRLNLADI
jgi:hypothetical protein